MILPFRYTFVSLSCESALSLKLLKKTFFNSEVLLIFWQWLWPVVQGVGTAEHLVFKQLMLTLWLKKFYGWIRHNTWPTWFLVWGKTVHEHARIQGSASLAAHGRATVAFVKRGGSTRSGKTFWVPGCKGLRFGNLTRMKKALLVHPACCLPNLCLFCLVHS